jgi:hypothetical protein
MIRKRMTQRAQLLLLLILAVGLGSCSGPQVYGSIGVSSYSKAGGSGRLHGSISIGGRIN